MRTPVVLCLCLLASLHAQQWYRGNTHAHTYWSDGDGAPELVVDGYKQRGYDFLVLSDHNVLQQGETWYPVKDKGRLNPSRLEALIERFGADQVVTRETDGQRELLLKTLPELRQQFQDAGFLLITGEEVTGHFGDAQLHVNALNIEREIKPGRGSTLRQSLQATLDAITAEGERLGRPVLGHVNHPNYVWSLTAEDLAAVRGEHFFEVYNGHRSTYNWGDATHPGMEQVWDQALTLRLADARGADALLYGLASDDSHNHHGSNQHSNPGRGWVMVRAAELSASAIVAAMRAGDFYASTGVVLAEIAGDAEGLRVEVRAEPGVHYRIEFVGTRQGADGPTPIGEVLQVSEDSAAAYRFGGDELYVRARISSDRLHPNPFAEGDFEMAWTQPVLGPGME